jgi:N-acetylglucosamine-6-phosphate deacetylase
MLPCRGRNAATGERVVVEGDRVIAHVDSLLDSPGGDDSYLAPGFIDLQVNGFAGVDYNSPESSAEEIGRSIDTVLSTGVTRFFPTVITGSPDRMLAALRNLARAREALPNGEAMEAFHVEGPHISPEDGPRGAHPAGWVRPPRFYEYQHWQEAAQGNVRLITLSPEWPGALRYIEQVTREGVAVAIGHMRATREQVRDAVSAGATLSTHLGNGAHAALPKTDNYIWDQLAADSLAASFIADRHHLPEAFLRAALRAKGVERSLLVTDAVAPAAREPGAYRLGEVEVELREDGRVVLRGSERLAGSSLRMDHAIANVMRIGGLSLTEALAMATVNPARIGRVSGRQRALRPGERADLVRFRLEDGRMEVLETWLSGRRVFPAARRPY